MLAVVTVVHFAFNYVVMADCRFLFGLWIYYVMPHTGVEGGLIKIAIESPGCFSFDQGCRYLVHVMASQTPV